MGRQRIVVIRPGALGDTLVAIDALLALRKRFPSCEVELVGNREAGAILVRWGLVNSALSFDGPEVTELFYGTPVVAERWRDARLVVLWLRGGAGLAQAFRAAGVACVIHASPEPEGVGQHVSDHLLSTLAPVGVSPSPSHAQACWGGFPSRHQGSDPPGHSALLHPGSGSPSKNWPPDRYAMLAELLARSGWSASLLRGPADAAAVEGVRSAMDPPNSGGIAILQPRDLEELTQVLEGAGLFVGNDSGVAHLGARLGMPTVAIFGPSDPRRWAPRGPRVGVVGGGGPWPSLDAVRSAICHLLDEGGESAEKDGRPALSTASPSRASEVDGPRPVPARQTQGECCARWSMDA